MKKKKRQGGTHRQMIDSYLCEFAWRKRTCRETAVFHNSIDRYKPILVLKNNFATNKFSFLGFPH